MSPTSSARVDNTGRAETNYSITARDRHVCPSRALSKETRQAALPLAGRSLKISTTMSRFKAEDIKPYDSTAAKTGQVRDMFDSIAPAYDLMNRMMTFGIDCRWRRKAIDMVCTSGKLGEVYNVGGHNERPNIFIVKKNNKYGVKSIYNDIIIPIEYDNIISDSPVLSTYFKLIKGTKKGIVNINGKIEFPLSEVGI